MDAEQIRRLQPMLTAYLKRFDDCFAQRKTRKHLAVYVEGQLSDLERKSVEPIALAAGVPVRTLQEFLSQHRWQEDRARDRLETIVANEHASEHSVGIIDETSVVKKGDKTPGVQRQYLGAVGKKDNGIVTVHLAYAADDFHCLLDGELFLPESWSQDRERCREAGIPEDMIYRPKTKIALELYDRAVANGIHFTWMTFDEGYGAKPEFLWEMDGRKQNFAAEVPKTFMGWIDPPQVTTRPFRKGRGRGRKTPRLASGSAPARTVEHLLWWHPTMKEQPWRRFRVKDGEKGPMVWEAKHTAFYPQGPDRLPMGRWHLVVARNSLDPAELKFFVSNAPAEIGTGTLLLVGFSRWPVERCFEDGKGEVGLDHYEGRRYLGLKRHLILIAISLLFLARTKQAIRKKKSGRHGMPNPHGRVGADSFVVALRPRRGEAARTHGGDDSPPPKAKRPRAPQPQPTNSPRITPPKHPSYSNLQVQMEH
jgi:SRSO17 transposase